MLCYEGKTNREIQGFEDGTQEKADIKPSLVTLTQTKTLPTSLSFAAKFVSIAVRVASVRLLATG